MVYPHIVLVVRFRINLQRSRGVLSTFNTIASFAGSAFHADSKGLVPLQGLTVSTPSGSASHDRLDTPRTGESLRIPKAYINHITKVEFFIAFKAAYLQSITVQNGLSGFRGAGLIPFDPQTVISKLDIKLRTPTPSRSSSVELDPWVSQTPHNSNDALSQSTLVKNRIAQHQGSSSTPIFETIAVLAKGTEILVYEITLISTEIRTFRKANEVLSKRRRAKKSRIREGGALNSTRRASKEG
ncbi:hypothetical protein SBOR_10167 [Sclerotinia borealis F-4128]|uniref:Uncharacterized protein n=1 Tax=Sclerotinia borealis (strain F-4128) TaxID=1432307 RepID=W9C4G6_SCLBF|nr:hypothetical protein SBOR_10167 [Sclerotinia borealis F-4128]